MVHKCLINVIYECLIYVQRALVTINSFCGESTTIDVCAYLFLIMNCICSLHTLPVALGNRLHDHTGFAPWMGREEGCKGKKLLCQPQQPYHHMDEANRAGISACQHDTVKCDFSSQHYCLLPRRLGKKIWTHNITSKVLYPPTADWRRSQHLSRSIRRSFANGTCFHPLFLFQCLQQPPPWAPSPTTS